VLWAFGANGNMAPFSTGRPFLLSVHVLDETMRGTSAAKCQQPLDRRGQLFRVTAKFMPLVVFSPEKGKKKCIVPRFGFI
jgi:hypothetical protein